VILADEENLVLVRSVAGVDELLARFYGRFPWPWPAKKFDFLDDPDFQTVMVNQDLGDWTHRTLSAAPRIWVAGCGVNQAIITALRFPAAEVVGSDVSARSLDLCAEMARQIGIANLELKHESINHVAYDGEFDYVICTGVLHHNAEPDLTLNRLARALMPSGIMELMVYNRFHRIVTSAFQKAVRIFSEARESVDFEWEVGLANRLVADLPVREVLEKAFTQYMEWSESDFADLLVQPVEHSYTLESLAELAGCCGLDLCQPCISSYAKHLAVNLSWNLEVHDAQLCALYFALPDARRWQITNLLLHDRSPLLWFYLQRRDAPRQRRSEREVCAEFLEQRFARCGTVQRSFIRGDDGTYEPLFEPTVYPLEPPPPRLREIAAACHPEVPIGEVLARLGFNTSFPSVNPIRLRLATSAFPYLRSVHVA
jgi:SAM-dependent methyltransferase